MAWKKGPLPKGTYGWGGVVAYDYDGSGFYFADFCGDHAKAIGGGADGKDRKLLAHEVKWYDNSLVLPPDSSAHATREGP